METMKLVIATPLYPPEIGGPATYAKLLEEGLPKKGVEVTLVNFNAARYLPKGIRHAVFFFRVLEAARKADAVLALDPVSVGLPASLAARLAKKPFIVKIVGDYAWEQGRQRFGVTQTLDEFVKEKSVPFPVRILRFIQCRVAQSATRIIVPSDYLKEIVSLWDMPHKKIKVVYNAVLVDDHGIVPKQVERLSRPLVVSVGRLVPWKGMEGVIDAVASLRKKGTEVSLAIVGDGPLRPSLVSHAEKELASGHVFTGALSHADTLATMRSADVLVLNSSYEGLAHILIEALMLGVPAIATRTGGNPEILKHRENGLLIEVNDTAELAGAITLMLEDSSLRAHLTAGARASAERFSLEEMLKATVAVLQAV